MEAHAAQISGLCRPPVAVSGTSITDFFCLFIHQLMCEVCMWPLTVEDGHLSASTRCLNHLPTTFQWEPSRGVDLQRRTGG